MYVYYMHASANTEAREGVGSSGTGVTGSFNCLMWVLGTEAWFSARIAGVLNHSAIYQAPYQLNVTTRIVKISFLLLFCLFETRPQKVQVGLELAI